jgi:hypothetical protein
MRAELSKKSKYYVPKNLFRECLYFCRQYPEWVRELSEYETLKGIDYGKDKIQAGETGDSTAVIAMRRYTLERKVNLVEMSLRESAPAFVIPWLKIGVTTEMSVWQLEAKGMSINRKTYFKYRRVFFFNLSQKI